MVLLVRSIVCMSFMFLFFTGNIFASTSDDSTKRKKKHTENVKNISPNGNYKHNMPVSEGNRFEDSFTKPAKETNNRNYKQQNRAKSDVKFRDHFTKPKNPNRGSYKHPQGL